MPFPTPPYFPYLYPRKKDGKWTIATSPKRNSSYASPNNSSPPTDCAYRIGKIDFTGAKGARPVRATSGQRGDHTGDKGVACYAPTETPRTHHVASVQIIR